MCAHRAGSAFIEAIATSQNRYAGDKGKTHFMMTAPTSIPVLAAAAPKGRIETAPSKTRTPPCRRQRRAQRVC
jgi:hypothetical protein